MPLCDWSKLCKSLLSRDAKLKASKLKLDTPCKSICAHLSNAVDLYSLSWELTWKMLQCHNSTAVAVCVCVCVCVCVFCTHVNSAQIPFAVKNVLRIQTFIAYEPPGQYCTGPQSPHRPSHSKCPVTWENTNANSTATIMTRTIVESEATGCCCCESKSWVLKVFPSPTEASETSKSRLTCWTDQVILLVDGERLVHCTWLVYILGSVQKHLQCSVMQLRYHSSQGRSVWMQLWHFCSFERGIQRHKFCSVMQLDSVVCFHWERGRERKKEKRERRRERRRERGRDREREGVWKCSICSILVMFGFFIHLWAVVYAQTTNWLTWWNWGMGV